MRLMLTRPPAHDTAHGLERFACRDIPAVLTRANCARRFVLASTLRRSSAKGEWTSDTKEARSCGVCRECPVGAIHAAEAGSASQGGRYRRPEGAASPPKDKTPALVRNPPPLPTAEPSERAPVRPVETPGNARAVSTGQRPSPPAAQNTPEKARRRPRTGQRPPDPRRAAGKPVGGRPSRVTITHPATGETMTIAEWAAKLGVPRTQIDERRSRGLPVEQVLAGYVRPWLRDAQEWSRVFRESGADARARRTVDALTSRIATARSRLAKLEAMRDRLVREATGRGCAAKGVADAAE